MREQIEFEQTDRQTDRQTHKQTWMIRQIGAVQIKTLYLLKMCVYFKEKTTLKPFSWFKDSINILVSQFETLMTKQLWYEHIPKKLVEWAKF